jgi:ATP-dependent RNA helicase RhlE
MFKKSFSNGRGNRGNKKRWSGGNTSRSSGGRQSFGRNRGFSQRSSGGRNNGQKIDASKYVSRAVEVQAVEQEQYAIQNKFTDFLIHDQLKQNISNRNYVEPTPIQDQIIPHILQGKDVVGLANTGTGKTAAFLIPLLNKLIQNQNHKALIVAPTRELAVQIEEELYTFSDNIHFSSVLCIGGASIGRQIHHLRNQTNIVIGTPGRLMDLTKRRSLDLSQFEMIVLDEVDRMVDIGFINDIKYLISLLPQNRQSLFFSATLSPQVQPIVQTFLKDPVYVSVKTKETAQSIEQDVIRVRSKEEKVEKLQVLLRQEEFKKVIIFGKTKWGVERLANYLTEQNIRSASIHGNKSQGQRLRALEDFKKDRLQVLVATDIAARGLDIPDVTHVINFDEPATYEDYVHRIGRTGRANKTGKALTFVI